MIARASRMRQIGWLAVLACCVALFVALTFRVNAVKSEVVRAERTIIALQRETSRLETEFQTRANQQQLANWNKVDFGYTAPRADQFQTERQLAALGEGRAPGAPAPIRVARAPVEGDAAERDTTPFMAMVSPLTGRAIDDGSQRSAPRVDMNAATQAGVSLAERLSAPIDLPHNLPDARE
jgi:hypothetical protein